jgi:hypothetical protein
MGHLSIIGRIVLQQADHSDTQSKVCIVFDHLNTGIVGIETH